MLGWSNRCLDRTVSNACSRSPQLITSTLVSLLPLVTGDDSDGGFHGPSIDEFFPPAVLFAGLYLGYTIWMDRRGGDRVNHSAHLWGALYGVGFTLLLNPELAVRFVRRLASPGSF